MIDSRPLPLQVFGYCHRMLKKFELYLWGSSTQKSVK